jgi:pimeloyl-ACP methyl ester carboxylesterase
MKTVSGVSHRVTVFLLPGLGATSELYDDYAFPFTTRAVNYQAPQVPGMSTAEYAAQLITENDIQPGDSLIGVSLGGMLSCEIAQLIPISKLTLVSSCTDSDHLFPAIRPLRHLAHVIPWRIIQKLPFPSFLLNPSRQRALEMFRRADATFIRWACLQAATWKCPISHPDIIQIHGDQDPLFPATRQKITHLIRGGDHLMILSHLQQIAPLLIARHRPNAQAH